MSIYSTCVEVQEEVSEYIQYPYGGTGRGKYVEIHQPGYTCVIGGSE